MCIRDRSDGVSSAIAKSIGFGSDGSSSNKLLFETFDDFATGVLWTDWVSDSAALTTWGELNWLKRVNETQKTKTAKLIKTSFT